MKLYLPHRMPALNRLQAEGLCVEPYLLDNWAEVNGAVLRVLLLNLMPKKPVTELDIARVLVEGSHDVQLIPVTFAGMQYKTTSEEHIRACYVNFEDLRDASFDGTIITGAPVEHLPFEEVRYWEQLCAFMDWAGTHAQSVLYICWGAQAGLYHHYAVGKYALAEKCFGIYQQDVLVNDSPLMSGMSTSFPMPNSRHTEVRRADLERCRNLGLRIVAASAESGVGVVEDVSAKRVFIVGHLEYEPYTLQHEYERDCAQGLPIHRPAHYYIANTPHLGIDYSWKRAAVCFYDNWLNWIARLRL